MAVVGILETAVYANDLEAAERFYAGLLGLEVDSSEPGRHVFLRCGDGMLLVFDPAATSRSSGIVPPHGAVGPGHVAFSVDDLEAWPDRFRDAGVEVEADVAWPGGGRSVYVRDPAENSVELTTPRIWQTA
ncbi:MAG: VOC family protein [Gaiellaceae bacterium]